MSRPPGPVRTFRLEDPPGVGAPGDGVTVHWHLPAAPGPRSGHGIVVLPVLAGDYEVCSSFARFFAARGYHCLRFQRRAEWLDPDRDPEVLGILLDRYVEDVRRGIAGWRGMGGPPAPLGFFGASMGAITGTVLAAREPALGPLVLCLGGGPLADVMADSADEAFREYRAGLEARRGHGHHEALRRLGESMEGLDPVAVAGRLGPGRTLVVAAAFDRVVRFRHQERLWEALGRPERVILPCGHYSAAWFVPIIERLALRWFDRHLAPGEGTRTGT